MYKKDGMVFRSEEEYLGELPEITAEKNKKRKGCLIAVVIAFGVFALLLFVFYKAMIPVNNTNFTPELIKSLEKEYNMELSSITPERHWKVAMAQDSRDQFRFVVSDYNDFMDNYFYGEIINFSESDDKSYAEYKCKPYPESENEKEKRFRIHIEFQKNGNKYNAKLISYYEVG